MRFIIGAAIAALGVSALGQQPARAQRACADLTDVRVAGQALEIEAAVEVAAGPAAGAGAALPAHCRVDGVIERRVGVGGREFGIGFAIALPASWNGRFLFQGGGGLNGIVRPPVGARAAGDTPALARGFAVVSADSGHQGPAFDQSFYADQEAALNFLYQAVGKVTVVAKALVAEHYGRTPDHSYFVGCSTGGREAMIASQRFPRYFDGLVAGAPAMRTGRSNIGMRWVSVALSQAAERDDHGSPIPGTALAAAERQLIVDSALARCDANDGIADGMIFNTQACDFDPDTLVCEAGAGGPCLSQTQADAVERAMAGATRSNGPRLRRLPLRHRSGSRPARHAAGFAQRRTEPGRRSRSADDAGRRRGGADGRVPSGVSRRDAALD